MQYEINKINGLSTRANRIDQSEFNCIDCDNVHKNGFGTLVKVNALAEELDLIITVIDAYHIRGKDEIFIIEAARFSRIINASTAPVYEALNTFPLNVSYTSGVNLSFQEMNGNLYFADPTEFSYVQKYDGMMITRAGVSVPRTDGDVATTYFKRVYFSTKDANGLETFGDYEQTPSSDLSASINVYAPELEFYPDRDIRGFQVFGYPSGVIYGEGATSQPSDISVLGEFTLEYVESNVIVGDIFYINYLSTGLADFELKELKCEVVNVGTSGGGGTGITLQIADYDVIGDEIIGFDIRVALSTFRVHAARSDNETYGYKTATSFNRLAEIPLTNYGWYSDDKTLSLSFSFQISDQDLEDIYDSTTIKGDMPKMRYISAFNNQIVGVTGDYAMAWSDLGLGSSCETFAPFDTEIFNKSDEGIITGIFGGDSFVSVFKDSEVYHIQGILYGRSYRIVKDSSSGVGCASHSSIVRFSGGCIFLSDKSFYYSNGQLSKELTDHIEDEIKAIVNKSTVRAVADYVEEKIYFIYDVGCFEFDYYYNDWWKHSLYTDKNMFLNVETGRKMLLISTDGLYEEDPALTKTHAGLYRTSWMTLGNPFFEKRFNYFIAISAYGVEFEAKTESFWNWGTEKDESFTKKFSATQFINEYGIQKKKANSFSFSMISEAGQDLSLDGFAVDYEPYQTKVRA